jgi:hypothetical protein
MASHLANIFGTEQDRYVLSGHTLEGGPPPAPASRAGPRLTTRVAMTPRSLLSVNCSFYYKVRSGRCELL